MRFETYQGGSCRCGQLICTGSAVKPCARSPVLQLLKEPSWGCVAPLQGRRHSLPSVFVFAICATSLRCITESRCSSRVRSPWKWK